MLPIIIRYLQSNSNHEANLNFHQWILYLLVGIEWILAAAAMIILLTLPSGLAWSDELSWTPVQQSTTYSLTGALLIQESTKQAGRPITLIGQSSGRDHTVWISRADLLALQTLLAVAGAEHTLTLHDGRTFTVMAAQGSNGPLDAEPLPATASFAPANPDDDYWYVLSALRLMEV